MTPQLIEDAARFLVLAAAFSAPGLSEYLLWETVEGIRAKPSPFMDPLTESDEAVLVRLRDMHQLWPFYNFDGAPPDWALCPIQNWKQHTRKFGFSAAYNAIQQRKLHERRVQSG